MNQLDPVMAASRGTGTPGASARSGITAAAGIGIFAGLAGAAMATLLTQARATVKVIENAAVEAAVADGLIPPNQHLDSAAIAQLPVPRADGVYLPDGSRQADPPPPVSPRPLVLAMLGDSTAVGYGTRRADELPGVLLAKSLATSLRRPVLLRTHGLSGCGAADLPRQIAEMLSGPVDLAVILVGANDIRDKVPPGRSAEYLGNAVAMLRSRRIPVVAGTCPDFGVIEQIPQPLRSVLQTWSRLLATLQERAVLAEGGRSVALGRLVSPEFAHHPEMFAGDRFHPSAAGYARAVAALLPAALEDLRQVIAAEDTAVLPERG